MYLARATDGASASTVAIKVMHPHLAADGDMVAMFLDEARIATRFRHANLVRVLDVDLVGDELSMVMDYVEGTTLAALQSTFRRRGERLPLGLSARVVCDALLGLQAMHELADEHGAQLGLVHRDVSPQNLLIGTDGVTRVADFGVALAVGRLASTRPDGTVKGKLQYLAPEQIGRKPLDRRVDVFAAGIVLWECLTGERLFAAATEAETVTRVLRDPIAPPSSVRPEVSAALDEACLRALERDPRRRFGTAADFAQALGRAVDDPWSAEQVGALVAEVAAEPIRRQREALQRRRRSQGHSGKWLVVASGAGLVLASSLGLLHLLPSRRASAAVAGVELSAARPVPAAPSAAASAAHPPEVDPVPPIPAEPSPPAPASAFVAPPRPEPSASAPRARAAAGKRTHAEAAPPTADPPEGAAPKKPAPASQRPFMPSEL